MARATTPRGQRRAGRPENKNKRVVGVLASIVGLLHGAGAGLAGSLEVKLDALGATSPRATSRGS
jgi:hypothetical protein